VTLGISVLAEPSLGFRYGQTIAAPYAGLSLFGPFDADASGRPSHITYGVVAAPEGLAAFRAFSMRLTLPIISRPYGDPRNDRKPQLLWPPFPGFEAAFGATWPAEAAWSRSLNREALLTDAQHSDKYRRAYSVCNHYLDGIRIAAERDEAFGLIICVVPDVVWLNCRPLSRVSNGIGVAVSKAERAHRRSQPDLFNPYTPEEYDLSVDFRRQLKARAMKYNIPLQLIRESTLTLREPAVTDSRNLTPFSDRAWNLSTAFYYKAGGKPWRLASARPGVCYVGLAFRRSELDAGPRTACCAAQMFLDTGDGVVFRGEFGPWYSERDDEYHLSADAAEDLLSGVLNAYAAQGGQRLSQIFLHSRSTISEEEFAGYRKACPSGVHLVGIRVRTDRNGLRLYRPGKWPVLRGTLWTINNRTAYLWATGFKPTLLSYDGWEVPAPLRIDIEHGDAEVGQVASDIFGLTKLNYNACKLGSGEPVTIGFSDGVGEILIGNPYIEVRRPSFKFYI
jgi:hypothetical protein